MSKINHKKEEKILPLHVRDYIEFLLENESLIHPQNIDLKITSKKSKEEQKLFKRITST